MPAFLSFALALLPKSDIACSNVLSKLLPLDCLSHCFCLEMSLNIHILMQDANDHYGIVIYQTKIDDMRPNKSLLISFSDRDWPANLLTPT